MGRVGFPRCRHLRVDQFAFTGDRQRHPFRLRAIASPGDEVKAERCQTLSGQCLGHVAYRNNPPSSQNHAFDFRRVVRKTKNAAGRDEFRNLSRRHGETPFAQSQQDERLQFEFERLRHRASSVPSAPSSAGFSTGSRAASSKASSSDERNPSGWTTGTTFWSSAVSPRYHCRSSWQKQRGSAWSRVMLVIFSMPSIKSPVRVLRSTKTSVPEEAGRLKCAAALTMKSDLSPRRTTWRTFRSPGASIFVALPERLSTLRTSCTEAEDTAKTCPLTRNRIICSVRTGLVFAGAASRISELLRVTGGKWRGRASRWPHRCRQCPEPDRRRLP